MTSPTTWAILAAKHATKGTFTEDRCPACWTEMLARHYPQLQLTKYSCLTCGFQRQVRRA